MSNFTDFLAAMQHGASTVYHDILQIETAVINWTADNPLLQALFQKGVDAGFALLVQYGIPVPLVRDAVAILMGMLKTLAALDPTVSSK